MMISSTTTRTKTEKTKPTMVRPSNNRRRRTQHPRCVPSGNNNNKNTAATTLIQYSLLGVAVALVHRAGLLSAATTSGAELWTFLWSVTSSSSSSSLDDVIILNGSRNVSSRATDGSKEKGVMAEPWASHDGEVIMGSTTRTTNVPAGQEGEPRTTNANNNKRLVCRFVMAETSLPGQNGGGGRYGIFALRDVPRQSPVLSGELAIPLPAVNSNTSSSRTAVVGDEKEEEDASSLTLTGLHFLLHQSNDNAAWSQGLIATGEQQQQQHKAIDDQSVSTPSLVTIGGLAMLANGHPDRFNVALRPNHQMQQHGGAGGRASDGTPSAYHPSRLHYYTASRSIQAGEEILVPSFDVTANRPGPSSDDDPAPPDDTVWSRPTAWLHEHGTCVDNLEDVPSASGRGGLGAQSTRFLPMGSIIAPVPVVPIARDSVVVQTDEDDDSHHHKIQMLLNYCYGHPESPVLLFPYGPAITLVNHDGVRPNAALRWSPRSSHGSEGMRSWNASQVLSHDPYRRPPSTASGAPPPPPLLLELVALRDIHPREEVFISYGADWQAAYHDHVEQQHQQSEQGFSASQRGNNITAAPADTLRHAAAAFRHAIGLPDGVFPAAWLTSSH